MWFRQETLLVVLIAVGAVLLFWRSNLRARETAVRLARSACQDRDLQFLDDTVALARLGIDTGGDGWALRRVYEFEFSVDGRNRRTGSVTLHGTTLETLFLPDQALEA
ncbi:MAG: DUF3301 domain-containing protein [Gammaproteobacteria bacterium]|nr:DUF3301 domain-containing protein [Gammaproteobacteria bacterium]